MAIITSIQERFVQDWDLELIGERGHSTLGLGDDGEMGECLMDGLEEGSGQRFGGFCGVIQSAMKLDVMEDGSLILSELVEGRSLLNHDVLEFGWGWSDGRAAEGGWVGPAGMSPDAHLSLLGEADGEAHGVNGSSVTATSYICE